MAHPPSKRKPKRQFDAAALTLTSLIDMFTIILLFLLLNYSAEGEITASNPKLKLPVSTSIKSPDMRLIVQVTTDDIIVDGIPSGKVKDALSSPDYTIEPLLATLMKNTEKIEFIMRNDPSFRFRGEITIQGDNRIPFILLEKVMYTCGQAGYGNISLAVISRD